jgi:hypothetical protein
VSKKRKSAKKITAISLPQSDIDAGTEWLDSLGEATFRDSILPELFRQMRAAKLIEWFENIHGRLDKGVDFLLVSETPLGQLTTGIQVKGKVITRAGAGATLSATRIAEECVGAMQHEFTVRGAKRRLDSIAIWTCSHVTPDAEEELAKPGLAYRIHLKKPRDIFSLIENHAPALLTKVPQLAIAGYVRQQANPEPEAVHVFGCRLNPKTHFLEPEFSRHESGSPDNIGLHGGKLKPKKALIKLDDILATHDHIAFFADELSGKSYLLKRCKALLAASRKIPVLITSNRLQELPRSAAHLLRTEITILSLPQAEGLAKGAGVTFLVDDIDKVPQLVRNWLFSLDPREFRVLAAGRSVVLPTSAALHYITGARLGSISRFLKSLNVREGRALLDRAQSFIERTLLASRLPSNPFTISIMLQECQHGGSRFSTPTMGRVIERFVELQLGSHSEAEFAVDFETKRDFLSELAGHRKSAIRLETFRKTLGKFIDLSKHPQTIDDFISDFRKSGVFTFTSNEVSWAHPAFKHYFWVRNLLNNSKHELLAKALCHGFNPTIAALCGSQINRKDVHRVVDPIVERLRKAPMPTIESLVPQMLTAEHFDDVMSDEDEKQLLSELEAPDGARASQHPFAKLTKASLLDVDDDEASAQDSEDSAALQLDPEAKAILRKRLAPWIEEAASTRLELAFNLSSVIVNARKARYETKLQALYTILTKARAFSHLLQKLLALALPQREEMVFVAGWSGAYAQFHIADRMVGDPFLLNVLRKMKSLAKGNEERLQLLDLLLCCGDDVADDIVQTLREIGRFDVTLAVYQRVVVLYYFRHSRDVDKKSLQKLLRDIRALDKKRLPAV